MITERAAVIAKALSEEWDSKTERIEAFVLRRFPADTFADFEAASNIMGELLVPPRRPPVHRP